MASDDNTTVCYFKIYHSTEIHVFLYLQRTSWSFLDYHDIYWKTPAVLLWYHTRKKYT